MLIELLIVLQVLIGLAFITLTIFTGSLVLALFSDAPFVITNKSTLRGMLSQANIKPNDVIVDLGSGDGRLVLAAARQGRIATGYELSRSLFLISQIRKLISGTSNAHFKRQDFITADLTHVDVVLAYLTTPAIKKLRPKLEQELPAGARVVSHGVPIPGWTPANHLASETNKKLDDVWLYIKK